MAGTYDFIVVGSGPAGSAVAAGLAHAPGKPNVLLLEAGGDNSDRNVRVNGQRWITFQNKDMNWGYKTAPQKECYNRELDYSRGRGIGGSTAINFGVFSIGARGDYEEWARIVGDKNYEWENIQRQLKSLETFHGDLPEGVTSKYVAPKASDHGFSGPLHIGYANEWERDVIEVMDAIEQAGFPLNPDHNSGNPIGLSVLISSAYKGLRSTAGDLLTAAPANLTVITNAPVQRLVLEGKKVIGVESNGTQYLASKEVILSAGALDSPKILMHSGIGPAKQLEEYNIPLVQDFPVIGQGLRDHCHIPLVYTRTPTSNDRRAFYGSQNAMADALEQWKKDGTGPWAKFACEMGIGWFKSDRLIASQEFKDLPASEQKYLMHETVPHYEIFTHFPVHWFVSGFPTDSVDYSCLLVFLCNAQTRGEVTLQSSDPNAPLKFDPKFLEHQFDRRAAIEGLREGLRIAKHEAYAKDTLGELAAPKSDSDEDLLDYWRRNISSTWHMLGTVKMGKTGDSDAAVDSDFKLKGFEGVRVADLSVCPVLPNCHPQAVAYVTGATCAEKLIKEYGLA